MRVGEISVSREAVSYYAVGWIFMFGCSIWDGILNLLMSNDVRARADSDMGWRATWVGVFAAGC